LGRRVDTLLITGCSTSACVRATATDAKSYQMRPIVIREAVQDRCEVLHEFTLFDIKRALRGCGAAGGRGGILRGRVS
jgi:nicotinamidase-related amidase